MNPVLPVSGVNIVPDASTDSTTPTLVKRKRRRGGRGRRRLPPAGREGEGLSLGLGHRLNWAARPPPGQMGPNFLGQGPGGAVGVGLGGRPPWNGIVQSRAPMQPMGPGAAPVLGFPPVMGSTSMPANSLAFLPPFAGPNLRMPMPMVPPIINNGPRPPVIPVVPTFSPANPNGVPRYAIRVPEKSVTGIASNRDSQVAGSGPVPGTSTCRPTDGEPSLSWFHPNIVDERSYVSPGDMPGTAGQSNVRGSSTSTQSNSSGSILTIDDVLSMCRTALGTPDMSTRTVVQILQRPENRHIAERIAQFVDRSPQAEYSGLLEVVENLTASQNQDNRTDENHSNEIENHHRGGPDEFSSHYRGAGENDPCGTISDVIDNTGSTLHSRSPPPVELADGDSGSHFDRLKASPPPEKLIDFGKTGGIQELVDASLAADHNTDGHDDDLDIPLNNCWVDSPDLMYYSGREYSYEFWKEHSPPKALYYSHRLPEMAYQPFYGPWTPQIMRRIQDKLGLSLKHLKWFQEILEKAKVPMKREVKTVHLDDPAIKSQKIATILIKEIVGKTLMLSSRESKPTFQLQLHFKMDETAAAANWSRLRSQIVTIKHMETPAASPEPAEVLGMASDDDDEPGVSGKLRDSHTRKRVGSSDPDPEGDVEDLIRTALAQAGPDALRNAIRYLSGGADGSRSTEAPGADDGQPTTEGQSMDNNYLHVADMGLSADVVPYAEKRQSNVDEPIIVALGSDIASSAVKDPSSDISSAAEDTPPGDTGEIGATQYLDPETALASLPLDKAPSADTDCSTAGTAAASGDDLEVIVDSSTTGAFDGHAEDEGFDNMLHGGVANQVQGEAMPHDSAEESNDVPPTDGITVDGRDSRIVKPAAIRYSRIRRRIGKKYVMGLQKCIGRRAKVREALSLILASDDAEIFAKKHGSIVIRSSDPEGNVSNQQIALSDSVDEAAPVVSSSFVKKAPDPGSYPSQPAMRWGSFTRMTPTFSVIERGEGSAAPGEHSSGARIATEVSSNARPAGFWMTMSSTQERDEPPAEKHAADTDTTSFLDKAATGEPDENLPQISGCSATTQAAADPVFSGGGPSSEMSFSSQLLAGSAGSSTNTTDLEERDGGNVQDRTAGSQDTCSLESTVPALMENAPRSLSKVPGPVSVFQLDAESSSASAVSFSKEPEIDNQKFSTADKDPNRFTGLVSPSVGGDNDGGCTHGSLISPGKVPATKAGIIEYLKMVKRGAGQAKGVRPQAGPFPVLPGSSGRIASLIDSLTSKLKNSSPKNLPSADGPGGDRFEPSLKDKDPKPSADFREDDRIDDGEALIQSLRSIYDRAEARIAEVDDPFDAKVKPKMSSAKIDSQNRRSLSSRRRTAPGHQEDPFVSKDTKDSTHSSRNGYGRPNSHHHSRDEKSNRGSSPKSSESIKGSFSITSESNRGSSSKTSERQSYSKATNDKPNRGKEANNHARSGTSRSSRSSRGRSSSDRRRTSRSHEAPALHSLKRSHPDRETTDRRGSNGQSIRVKDDVKRTRTESKSKAYLDSRNKLASSRNDTVSKESVNPRNKPASTRNDRVSKESRDADNKPPSRRSKSNSCAKSSEASHRSSKSDEKKRKPQAEERKLHPDVPSESMQKIIETRFLSLGLCLGTSVNSSAVTVDMSLSHQRRGAAQTVIESGVGKTFLTALFDALQRLLGKVSGREQNTFHPHVMKAVAQLDPALLELSASILGVQFTSAPGEMLIERLLSLDSDFPVVVWLHDVLPTLDVCKEKSDHLPEAMLLIHQKHPLFIPYLALHHADISLPVNDITSFLKAGLPADDVPAYITIGRSANAPALPVSDPSPQPVEEPSPQAFAPPESVMTVSEDMDLASSCSSLNDHANPPKRLDLLQSTSNYHVVELLREWLDHLHLSTRLGRFVYKWLRRLAYGAMIYAVRWDTGVLRGVFDRIKTGGEFSGWFLAIFSAVDRWIEFLCMDGGKNLVVFDAWKWSLAQDPGVTDACPEWYECLEVLDCNYVTTLGVNAATSFFKSFGDSHELSLDLHLLGSWCVSDLRELFSSASPSAPKASMVHGNILNALNGSTDDCFLEVLFTDDVTVYTRVITSWFATGMRLSDNPGFFRGSPLAESKDFFLAQNRIHSGLEFLLAHDLDAFVSLFAYLRERDACLDWTAGLPGEFLTKLLFSCFRGSKCRNPRSVAEKLLNLSDRDARFEFLTRSISGGKCYDFMRIDTMTELNGMAPGILDCMEALAVTPDLKSFSFVLPDVADAYLDLLGGKINGPKNPLPAVQPPFTSVSESVKGAGPAAKAPGGIQGPGNLKPGYSPFAKPFPQSSALAKSRPTFGRYSPVDPKPIFGHASNSMRVRVSQDKGGRETYLDREAPQAQAGFNQNSSSSSFLQCVEQTMNDARGFEPNPSTGSRSSGSYALDAAAAYIHRPSWREQRNRKRSLQFQAEKRRRQEESTRDAPETYCDRLAPEASANFSGTISPKSVVEEMGSGRHGAEREQSTGGTFSGSFALDAAASKHRRARPKQTLKQKKHLQNMAKKQRGEVNHLEGGSTGFTSRALPDSADHERHSSVQSSPAFGLPGDLRQKLEARALARKRALNLQARQRWRQKRANRGRPRAFPLGGSSAEKQATEVSPRRSSNDDSCFSPRTGDRNFGEAQQAQEQSSSRHQKGTSYSHLQNEVEDAGFHRACGDAGNDGGMDGFGEEDTLMDSLSSAIDDVLQHG